MSSVYGNNIKISIFGQSHSAGLGVVVDGLPAGFTPDIKQLKTFMSRRAPNAGAMSTKRKEADEFEILSGLSDGSFNGAPFCAVIRNTNAHSSDYEDLRDIPRPGHADYTAQIKFGGSQDVAGGGHFSGRLTAALCLAGGLIIQILEDKGINIGAHIERIGNTADRRFDPVHVETRDFRLIREGRLPVLEDEEGLAMEREVENASQEGDSLGGIIECAVIGMEAGIGDPMFDGLENKISSAVFAVPAVKGIEFGIGFECSVIKGSNNNDPYYMDGSTVKTKTNNHGGILGGISSGMPIIFRVAIKPTPSIYKEQESISISKGIDTMLKIKGRHDPCIVPRAVPCIEAAAAIAVYDAYLESNKQPMEEKRNGFK